MSIRSYELYRYVTASLKVNCRELQTAVAESHCREKLGTEEASN
jgi:hypothetical protein